MKVNDTTFDFVNCYLPVKTIDNVMNNAYQHTGIAKFKRSKIMKSDYVFLVGDFNMKFNMDPKKAENILE